MFFDGCSVPLKSLMSVSGVFNIFTLLNILYYTYMYTVHVSIYEYLFVDPPKKVETPPL